MPHAGEVAGPPSVRGALEALGADRLRHGIRSVEDSGLVAELADRGIVLDVCPLSNLRTGAVASLEEHPLPQLVAAGVRCSISTDDPAMFDTDLERDYEAAASLGVSRREPRTRPESRERSATTRHASVCDGSVTPTTGGRLEAAPAKPAPPGRKTPRLTARLGR